MPAPRELFVGNHGNLIAMLKEATNNRFNSCIRMSLHTIVVDQLDYTCHFVELFFTVGLMAGIKTISLKFSTHLNVHFGGFSQF